MIFTCINTKSSIADRLITKDFEHLGNMCNLQHIFDLSFLHAKMLTCWIRFWTSISQVPSKIVSTTLVSFQIYTLKKLS